MAEPASTHRRSTRQRAIGARYDELHALLVRCVHPICFGAFVLLAGAIVIGGVMLAFELVDADVLAIVFAIAVSIGAAVVAAFTFVFTRARAWTSIVLLLGFWFALTFVDDIDTGVLWAIWSIATFSIAIQVVLLAWVTPRRIRGGLGHLLAPATVGTTVGAVPVALGLQALLVGDDARALHLAQLLCGGALVVVIVLLALHGYVRRAEQEIVHEFAQRQQLVARPSSDPSEAASPLLELFMPAWADSTPTYAGELHDREAAIRSGFSMSRAPDVPSLHLTVLAMRLDSTGRDLWVRRRAMSHDNVLVGTDHAGVVRFESIALDEGWSVRFAPGTTALDSFRTIGPQVLELLERSLGDAQVCRIGDAVFAWIVGGAVSANELDTLATMLGEFG